jgi:hypothetical protein
VKWASHSSESFREKAEAATGSAGEISWVARASRVLVAASRCDDLSKCDLPLESSRTGKSAMARTPLPARETRALPLLLQLAEPTQRDGRLRVIDFMAAMEGPDSNSLEAGSLD